MPSSSSQPPLNAAFVVEGHFVCLPLGQGNECWPIRPEESLISCLLASDDGMRLHGATGGEACHCFTSTHKGSSGFVLDLGIVPQARRVAALVECPLPDDRRGLLIFAEADHGLDCHRVAQPLLLNTIQEPPFGPTTIRHLASHPDRATLLGAAPIGDDVLCLTEHQLLRFQSASHSFVALAELAIPPALPPFALAPDQFAWLTADGQLCHWQAGSGCRHLPTRLPPIPQLAAHSRQGNRLLLATPEGQLHECDLANGDSRHLATAFLPHVHCLAALADGRAYGVCGDDIGHLFRLDPDGGELHDLGVIAAVLGHPRHGFEFAAAVATREGAIYLGEHDRGGCLWLYFPPATPTASLNIER